MLPLCLLASTWTFAQVIPSGDIRIHYFRPDGNYSGWTVYAVDNTTEDTGNYGGGPVPVTGTDSYGAYFDVGVTTGAQEVGIIIHNPTAPGGDQKDTPYNLYVDPATQGSQFWSYSGIGKLYNTAISLANPTALLPGYARIHYHRPDGNYANWTVYAFDDTTEYTGDYDDGLTGVTNADSFGAYFDIGLIPNAQNLGFIVHNISTGVQDPGGDMYLNVGTFTQAWVISGDTTVFTTPPSISCATSNPNPNPNPNSFAAVGDFNGDCKSDILWRNTSTQQVYEWFMNGTTYPSSGSPGSPTSDWVIQGAGDFDGDGKADILWRNSTTGEVFLWLMNGSTIANIGSLGYVSSGWIIRGVGDFNGDGKADILWRNSTTGQVYLWLINGTTMSGGGSVTYISSDWVIQGIGDFNGDGMADILWRNTTTGEVYIWLMNGATLTTSGSLGYVSSDWSIAGVGDFDGDGKSDILWRNSTTGQVYLWFINGTTMSGGGSVTYVPSDWVIQGVGDYDGSGRAGILWRNSTTEQVYIWLMNGATLTSSGSPGTPGAVWQIPVNPAVSGVVDPYIPYSDVVPGQPTATDVANAAKNYIGAQWGAYNCTGLVWAVSDAIGADYYESAAEVATGARESISQVSTIVPDPGNPPAVPSTPVGFPGYDLPSSAEPYGLWVTTVSSTWIADVSIGDLVRIPKSAIQEGIAHSFIVVGGDQQNGWVVIDNTVPSGVENPVITISEHTFSNPNNELYNEILSASVAYISHLDPSANSIPAVITVPPNSVLGGTQPFW